MQKHIRENGNVIYGDLSKQVNLKLDFKGKNNIVFFAGGSNNVNIIFSGNNGLVFIGTGIWFGSGSIRVPNSGMCFMDDTSSFGGTHFSVLEAKNIIVGRRILVSWNTWLSTCDHHLIMDSQTNDRINFSKSIYIGDHVWCGQDTAISKGSFVASGAVIGAKSLATKLYFSNTVNAGIPAKEIKNNIFWLEDNPNAGQWTKEQTLKHSNIPNENFKYTYNQNEFLSPKAIEAKLDSLNTAQEKLEFVYDAIYMNKNKNRFAYFKDMPYDIPLPKYESKFKLIEFTEINPQPAQPVTPPKPTTPPQPTPQEQISSLKEEINKKDKAIKEFSGKLSLQEANLKSTNESLRKKDLEIKNLEITSQNIKNHLSYKLGAALIKAHKQWYKGGYIKFIFEAIKIQNEHKFKR
ncbi:hypothetical protein [Campylobacter hyointestinalis]|uniref:hypothetical protein n=1 Tax=Campylobacter hyointestinalis TaxID=198 RepID=UPI000DCD38B9|nr:hypothetical protein [Campylobacter hyointestinalis]RAZ49945.1 hypothetical protein CHL9004_04005 [Campylobacter hyointestinalis subsp. lawsonii]